MHFWNLFFGIKYGLVKSTLDVRSIDKWSKSDGEVIEKWPKRKSRENEVACSYIGHDGRWWSDLGYTQGEFLLLNLWLIDYE